MDHNQFCFVLIFHDERRKGGREEEEGRAATQASEGKPEARSRTLPLTIAIMSIVIF